MNEILCRQLAIDYCCTKEEVRDRKNHFYVYKKQKGRRKFQENEECFLKIVVVNNKILVAGEEMITKWCQETFAQSADEWFMQPQTITKLNEKLLQYGYEVNQAHPFYIADKRTIVDTKEYEIRFYEGNEIEQFRGDERFDEAFAFCEDAPDEIGVAAVVNGEILGMAGASSDSTAMWQIGINVMPTARGQNIGPMLVELLKNKVLEMGKVPFYGTEMSHIASQKVAIKAGFMPAWAELSTQRTNK